MSTTHVSPSGSADTVVGQSSIASLIDGKLPAATDWLRSESAAPEAKPFAFRFCVNEVPYQATIVRKNQRAVVSLTGELGTLPFSAESARRRQRLMLIVAAAQRRSSLNWAINTHQQIIVSGDIEIAERVTPTEALAGAIALMLRARPYTDLIVSVGGED